MIDLPAEQWQSCSRYPELTDIPGAASWLKLAEIDQPEDMKRQYAVMDQQEQQYLIRVVDRTCYDRIKNEYEHLKRLREMGLPAPEPVAFGFCDHGKSLYLQTGWIEGYPMSSGLGDVRLERQYALGTRAGLLLKIVHGCQIPARISNGPAQFDERCRKVLGELRMIRTQPTGVQKLVRMLNEGRTILSDQATKRPFCLLHGSFTPTSILLAPDWEVYLTRFSNWRYGDPLMDLSNVLTSIRKASVPFAIGVLDCYFIYKPDEETLILMSCYAAADLLERYAASCRQGRQSNLPVKNDLMMTTDLKDQIDLLSKDFPGTQNVFPSWYKRIKRAE
jgi:aminoglycoside phosphotransferase (APT) family kinase protein